MAQQQHAAAPRRDPSCRSKNSKKTATLSCPAGNRGPPASDTAEACSAAASRSGRGRAQRTQLWASPLLSPESRRTGRRLWSGPRPGRRRGRGSVNDIGPRWEQKLLVHVAAVVSDLAAASVCWRAWYEASGLRAGLHVRTKSWLSTARACACQQQHVRSKSCSAGTLSLCVRPRCLAAPISRAFWRSSQCSGPVTVLKAPG